MRTCQYTRSGTSKNKSEKRRRFGEPGINGSFRVDYGDYETFASLFIIIFAFSDKIWTCSASNCHATVYKNNITFSPVEAICISMDKNTYVGNSVRFYANTKYKIYTDGGWGGR